MKRELRCIYLEDRKDANDNNGARASSICSSLESHPGDRLESWFLYLSAGYSGGVTTRLEGNVYQHPRFPDGTFIVTNNLLAIRRTDSATLGSHKTAPTGWVRQIPTT